MNRFFAALLLLSSISCSTPPAQQQIPELEALNFSDSTFISLKVSGLKEPEAVAISYYQIIPGWVQKTNPIELVSDTTLQLYIKPQQPYFAKVRIREHAIPFFVVPGDSLQIQIDAARLAEMTKAVQVSKHQDLTHYYLKKEERLGAAFRNTSYMLMSTEADLALLARGLDSLQAIELAFLNTYSDTTDLPQWFIGLEADEITYNYAQDKLGAEGYNRGYLKREVSVPEGYYDFIREVALHSENSLYSPAYLWYLEQLSSHHYLSDSLNKLDRTSRMKGLLIKEMPFYDSLLAKDGKVAGLVKAQNLARTSFYVYPQLKELIDAYIQEIGDPILLGYTYDFAQAYALKLKSGDEAPGFMLWNEKDKDFRLSDFKDSLVYISFWATWCKPCLDEFPKENDLVRQFADQPVKIISICLDSEKEAWHQRIRKHQLKTLNLYAEGNWNEMLKEKYAVVSLPHYVLIDKSGKIIQNKALRPSEKVDSLINQHLNYAKFVNIERQ